MANPTDEQIEVVARVIDPEAFFAREYACTSDIELRQAAQKFQGYLLRQNEARKRAKEILAAIAAYVDRVVAEAKREAREECAKLADKRHKKILEGLTTCKGEAWVYYDAQATALYDFAKDIRSLTPPAKLSKGKSPCD